MSSTAGATTTRHPAATAGRPTTRTTARPTPRPRLRVVPPPRLMPRRAPFVAVVLGLLVVGLATLLVLNTVLAQGAFRVSDLENQVALLVDDEQALQQQVAELAAPSRLSHQARLLGMVPMVDPAFLRTSDGKVLGRAAASTGLVPQWARPYPVPTPTAATPTAATPTAAGDGDAEPKPKATRARQSDNGGAAKQTGTSTQGGQTGDGGAQR